MFSLECPSFASVFAHAPIIIVHVFALILRLSDRETPTSFSLSTYKWVLGSRSTAGCIETRTDRGPRRETVASEIVFHPPYSHVIRTDCCPFAHLLPKTRDTVRESGHAEVRRRRRWELKVKFMGRSRVVPGRLGSSGLLRRGV